MVEKKDYSPTEDKSSAPNWRDLPFDAATNFSLIGWILDKFIKREQKEEKIDLRLDE